MIVSYGLSSVLSRDEIFTFAATVPNAGFTDRIDGAVVDLYVRDGEVKTDPTDFGEGEVYDMISEELERSLSIPYQTAADLQFGGGFAVEGFGKEGARQGGWRCIDLETLAADARGLAEDREAEGNTAGAEEANKLAKFLARALELHFVVHFGE